jgi:hypothetical protein
MARRARIDAPDSFHHVMNHGANDVRLFETPADFNAFEALLAGPATRGDVEIHAYALLSTHFHLLVRSPRGALGRALHAVETPYAAHLNRTRRRAGAVYRARFRSIPVRSHAYRCLLVRYVDWNPVAAGLCAHPFEYAHGSAAQYARGDGPAWLTRDWVEAEACALAGSASFTAGAYAKAFGAPTSSQERFVARRLAARGDRDDALDDLLLGGEEAFEARLLRGGGRRVAGVVDDDALERALHAASTRGPLRVPGSRCARDDLRVGLFLALTETTQRELAVRIGEIRRDVECRAERHDALLREHAEYRREAIAVAMDAMVRCHGVRRRA